MFEQMTDRIAGTLLMGLDVAVEFATLGEFRIVDPALATAAPYDVEATPSAHRPMRSPDVGADRSHLPRPATALAKATATPPEATPPIRLRMPPRSTLRPATSPAPARMRTRPASPVRSAVKPTARSRGGEVPTAAQLCLFGRQPAG
jgi:hypothetical protein